MDGPKVIILNVDLNDAMIRMDNEEISMMRIRQALGTEDPMVRKNVMTLLAFQYYSAYEPGQYVYNPCK
jgi:hypothetical protein